MSGSGFITPLPEDTGMLPTAPDRAVKPGPCLPDLEHKGASLTPALLKFWQRLFSFPVMLGGVLVCAMATIARTFFVDPDVWWHIKQGAFILATHQLPTSDIYSFTLSGHPWTSYEWLGDVLLAGVYQLCGMQGLEVLLIVLGGAILIALYVLSSVRSGNSKAAFAATAVLFVLATVSFNLRPQMLGYLFLILTLTLLERFRQGHQRALWALPILMLLWVNTHGSWIIGLGIIAVYLACGMVELQYGDIKAKRWNPADRLRLGIALGLCACATLITPYGATLAKYPFQVAFSLPVGVANVVEWRPMPFNLLVGKIFLVLLLGSILLQVVYRFQWPMEEFVLFLFAAAVACLHIRFLLIFVPIFAMRLAVILSRWIPAYERVNDRHFLNAIFIAVMLGLMVRYFPSEANLLRNVSKNYPVAAVEYLNQHFVPGPMYNAYGFGGYLIFSRGPEHKVFIDGRSELYERGGIWPDFLEVMDVRPDALSILRKYGIQSCLIEHDEPLATFLSALPTWEKVYEDSTSILFIRRNGSQGSVALSPGAPSQDDRRL